MTRLFRAAGDRARGRFANDAAAKYYATGIDLLDQQGGEESLPKLDADSATLSDRIFVFDYMMVSLMIVISILLVNGFVARRRWLKRLLVSVHIVVVPAMLGVMAWYVYGLSQLE